MEQEKTSGIGVYCKCGGIIYCCTDTCYSEHDGKKEIDAYFDLGYSVGRVTKGKVQELFGCKCVPETHIEKIQCTECNHIQDATVEHTIPFYSYVHNCEKCGYVIMESEWNKID